MNARSYAKIASDTPMPRWRCVAPPATDLVPDPMTGRPIPRGYRGADHMNCHHPTPPPPGYHHCEGDGGCPILLQAGRFCVMHGDLSDDLSPAERARPVSSAAAKQTVFANRSWGL